MLKRITTQSFTNSKGSSMALRSHCKLVHLEGYDFHCKPFQILNGDQMSTIATTHHHHQL